MKSTIIKLDGQINGNGKPGILDFVTATRAQLKLLVWLVGVALVLLGMVVGFEANRQLHGEFSLQKPNGNLASINFQLATAE